MYTILGAGLAGISASYHLGHENCVVYEKKNHIGGHIYTDFIDGFTWDEGPHVSFTKHEYVKQLFAENVEQQFLEYPVETANYYNGCWIPHPAQSNLFAIPQPLRDACLKDFLNSREQISTQGPPSNYAQWLKFAFGETFYNEFPKLYTQKYWTVDPELLTIDWVGERVFYPNVEEVKAGFIKPLEVQTHYISSIRYPKKGGYFAYTNKIRDGINAKLNKELSSISFHNKTLTFEDGSIVNYNHLIVTIPLPELIAKSDAPEYVKKAADRLVCSSVLLVNVTANHPTKLRYNWMYVYDKDKYCTRINCTELLSPNNAPAGQTGVQVEVYFSKYKPLEQKIGDIAEKVKLELVEMGLIDSLDSISDCHTKWVPWANVVFDQHRKSALDEIFNWLLKYGLKREDDDIDPMTDWVKKSLTPLSFKDSNVILSGRFAQWKYYWSDDCVMRGKFIAEKL
jgi:protoporphyrinogen oxidase